MSSEIIKKILNPFCRKALLRTPNSELRTSFVTRRHFLRWLLGMPLLTLFPVPAQLSHAEASPPSKSSGRGSIGEFFDREELLYEIRVWLLKRVALGRLTFKEGAKKGLYIATLQAETLGVLGWVARYRVDTYRATMEEVEGGRRFRALSFEEDVKVGSKVRKRAYLFDYSKNKWIKLRQRKDGTLVRTEEKIPPGMIYDDFLTASFNFRYGAYGTIERGRKYLVPTFPKMGKSNYEVTVAAKEEEVSRRSELKQKDGKEFFVKLYLDPEVTHSKEGVIEGWLSKELYPMEGTIRDVVFFGDVKGTLVKNTKG